MLVCTTDCSPHNQLLWQELMSLHTLCGDRKDKGFRSKNLEDMKRTSCDTEAFLLKLKGMASLPTERKTSACATSKRVPSESHLFQRRNGIQDLCTVVHFKWKFKPTVPHSMHGFCWTERQQETNAPIWPHKSITENRRYTHRREKMINRSVMCKFLFNSKIRLEIAFCRTPCQGHEDFAIVRIF